VNAGSVAVRVVDAAVPPLESGGAVVGPLPAVLVGGAVVARGGGEEVLPTLALLSFAPQAHSPSEHAASAIQRKHFIRKIVGCGPARAPRPLVDAVISHC
jgi:hypothetical protein